MKEIKSFSFLILSLSLLINCVNADEITTGRVAATYGVKLRESETTSSSSLLTIPYNSFVTVLRSLESGNGCDDNWFEVVYNTGGTSNKGFVCSTYIQDIETKNINETDSDKEVKEEVKEEVKNESLMSKMTDEEFDAYLTSEGFPNDYKVKLKELHKLHPNWIFKANKSKYTWSNALKEQNNPGNSFLNINPTLKAKGYEGFLSTNSGDYDYNTDTFIPHDGKYWFQARSETIEYYMDPRRYLDERAIFAFEDLLYYKDYQTLDAVNKVLYSDFLKQFGAFFIAAAERFNVSPVYLASLSRQEVGVTNTNIVTNGKAGVLSDGVDYTGYYNFFNIGASSSNDPKLKSLQRAKKENWTSEEKAIVEGGYFISVNYIACGQYTSYFQKFNVSKEATKGIWHQYTTNLDALTSPAISTYNSYKSMGLIDEPFTFTIPVFDGLPSETHLPNLGNPNNYLKVLKVNGISVTNFSGEIQNYDVLIPYSEKLYFEGDTVNDLSIAEVLEDYEVHDDHLTVKIKVTAQNKEERIYTLNIYMYEEEKDNEDSENIVEDNKDNEKQEDNKDSEKQDDNKDSENIVEDNKDNEKQEDNKETENKEQEVKTEPKVDTKINDEGNKENTNIPKILISDVIASSIYKQKESYLTNITLGSSVETIINNLKNKYKTISINIKNRNNEAKTSGTISTGDKVIIETGVESATFEIVIYGDVNGDGNISAIDLLNIQKK